MCSHLILSIFPPLSFFGDCQPGREELHWWVSLSPLTQLRLFSGKAAPTASVPSPDRRTFNIFISSLLSIHLVSTSLSEAKEEKALQNIRVHTKWSSSGVSWGPPIWELAVGRAFCFFQIPPSFVPYSFSFHTRPGGCGCYKAHAPFQTLMESSLEDLFRSGEAARWCEIPGLRSLGYKELYSRVCYFHQRLNFSFYSPFYLKFFVFIIKLNLGLWSLLRLWKEKY